MPTGLADDYGSRAYVIYGLLPRFSVGIIPIIGLNHGVGLGDLTAQAQYRLTQFQPGRPIPTMSVVAQETFPTGSYDRLGSNASNALGAGAHSTTLGF
ncbi:MAG TPA: transporter [Gemmatimonadaceae bacterium]|nr:transporter [Gemmatimonadaceae bacterium]